MNNETCRHKNGWDYIQLPKGFEICTRCRKCGREFGGEWRAEDQALWHVAVMIAYRDMDWELESSMFCNLWSLSILMGR